MKSLKVYTIRGRWMQKEDRATMRHISETLDEMLAIQKKPQGKLWRIFEIASTFVSILGALTIIDVVKAWLGG
jgi:hypothetical protein